MPEANEAMLNRSISPEVKKILLHYADHVEEATNFGTQLVLWQGDPSRSELLVTKLMLRYFLEIMDALSVLIKAGSAEACKSLLRSLFELNMFVDFIYQKHTAERAAAFLIAAKYDQLKELDKLDVKTERGKLIKANFHKEQLIKDFGQIEDPLIAQQKQDIAEYLQLPEHQLVVAEYERIRSARKNLQWYSLFEGAANIEALAKLLNKYTHYEVLYRNWSKTVHGTEIMRDKLVQLSDTEAYMRPIRQPANLANTAKMACNLAINTFSYYVQGSFPVRYGEYKQWQDEFIAAYEEGLEHEYISFS